MPTDTNIRLHRTWRGFRKPIRSGSNRGCTVTFNYPERGLCTVVASSFRAAVLEAVSRWGNDYTGEPCVSTPESIYNDLTGWTKANHGQNFGATDHWTRKRDRFRRTGQPYA